VNSVSRRLDSFPGLRNVSRNRIAYRSAIKYFKQFNGDFEKGLI